MSNFWHETIDVLCVVALFAAASYTARGVVACVAVVGIVFIHNWRRRG